MASSKLEQVIEDLVTEYSKITVANGYRNDVKTVLKSMRDPVGITSFPEIQITITSEKLKSQDSAWSVFDSIVGIAVWGFANCQTDTSKDNTHLYEAGMSLLHDMKSITGSIMKTYVVTTSHLWNISPNTHPIEFIPTQFLPERKNTALVAVFFDVQIRNQTSAFT
jgi:hypothetical protein